LLEVRGLGIVRLPYQADVELKVIVLLTEPSDRLPRPERHPALRFDPEAKWCKVQERIVRDVVKILAGLIAIILLVLTILRPLVRNLVTPMRDAVFPPESLSGPDAADRTRISEAEAAGERETSANIAYEQQLAAARSLVTQDPKRVAQAVKTWVGKDD
jgi:flagellar biosynthesis/type III secretory pathway M-ring protein FliF/YscJ